jgi:hypothetical protein
MDSERTSTLFVREESIGPPLKRPSGAPKTLVALTPKQRRTRMKVHGNAVSDRGETRPDGGD